MCLMSSQCDKNKIPFVCKGPSATIQPAHCLHTLRKLEDLSPTHNPPPSHHSLLKSKHHPRSRLLLFSTLTPKMKEVILRFQPRWFTHTRGHVAFSSRFSDSRLDRWMQLFPFSAFFSKGWGTRCCSPGQAFKRSTSSPSERVSENANAHSISEAFNIGTLCGGWVGVVTA